MRKKAVWHVLRLTFGPARDAANSIYGWLPVALSALAAVATAFGFRDPTAVNHSRPFWIAIAAVIVAALFARAAYIEYVRHHLPFPDSDFTIKPLGWIDGEQHGQETRFLLFQFSATNRQPRRMIVSIDAKIDWDRFGQPFELSLSEGHGNLNPAKILVTPITIPGDEMVSGNVCYPWHFKKSFGITFNDESQGFAAEEGSRFVFTITDHLSQQTRTEYVDGDGGVI
jgi:hypothetical protein